MPTRVDHRPQQEQITILISISKNKQSLSDYVQEFNRHHHLDSIIDLKYSANNEQEPPNKLKTDPVCLRNGENQNYDINDTCSIWSKYKASIRFNLTQILETATAQLCRQDSAKLESLIHQTTPITHKTTHTETLALRVC